MENGLSTVNIKYKINKFISSKLFLIFIIFQLVISFFSLINNVILSLELIEVINFQVIIRETLKSFDSIILNLGFTLILFLAYRNSKKNKEVTIYNHLSPIRILSNISYIGGSILFLIFSISLIAINNLYGQLEGVNPEFDQVIKLLSINHGSIIFLLLSLVNLFLCIFFNIAFSKFNKAITLNKTYSFNSIIVYFIFLIINSIIWSFILVGSIDILNSLIELINVHLNINEPLVNLSHHIFTFIIEGTNLIFIGIILLKSKKILSTSV